MFSLRILLAALLLCTTAAFGQSFPTKPLRIVVPFPAGATTDIISRLVAQRMSETIGQPVVVENQAGAGAGREPRDLRHRQGLRRRVDRGVRAAGDHCASERAGEGSEGAGGVPQA